VACPNDVHPFLLIVDSPCEDDSLMQAGSLHLLSQRHSFRAIADKKQSSFRYARQHCVPGRNCQSVALAGPQPSDDANHGSTGRNS
jgi:hypothetical protein